MRGRSKTILKSVQAILAVLVLAMMPLAMSAGCASTTEEGGDGANRDELCDEADFGTEGCPD